MEKTQKKKVGNPRTEHSSRKQRILDQIHHHLQDAAAEDATTASLPTATSILVTGMPDDVVDTAEVVHWFGRMGQITRSVRKPHAPLEIVYVRRSSAVEAVQRLDGTLFEGHVLRVRLKPNRSAVDRDDVSTVRHAPVRLTVERLAAPRSLRPLRHVRILDQAASVYR